jgi:hypothetical protein
MDQRRAVIVRRVNALNSTVIALPVEQSVVNTANARDATTKCINFNIHI